MVTEDVSKFIKEIRKKNNLTQKELADKLGVTYQAVSKWENGKNIPDIETLKEISNIFKVDVNDIIGNTKSSKKNNKFIIIIIILLVFLAIFLTVFIITKNSNNFEFKQISATCDDFKITGSAAYNKKTSSLYISKVEFCGKNDEVYKTLECSLYEEYGNNKVKISSYDKSNDIDLKTYLRDVSLNVNNYSTVCKKFQSSNMYVEIDAVDYSNKITTYKIPIKLKDNCK